MPCAPPSASPAAPVRCEIVPVAEDLHLIREAGRLHERVDLLAALTRADPADVLGEVPHQRRRDRAVGLELAYVDLVERVRLGMVVREVGRAVLVRDERRDALDRKSVV